MLTKRVYIWFNSHLTCVKGEVKADTIRLTLFTAANPIQFEVVLTKKNYTVLSLCCRCGFELPATALQALTF